MRNLAWMLPAVAIVACGYNPRQPSDAAVSLDGAGGSSSQSGGGSDGVPRSGGGEMDGGLAGTTQSPPGTSSPGGNGGVDTRTGGGAGATGQGGTVGSGGTTGGGASTGGASTGGASTSTSAPAPALLARNPTSVPFGLIALGQKSAAQSVSVSNQGQSASGELSLKIDNTDFSIASGMDTDCRSGTKLDPGASCSVRIVFAPSAAAVRSGTLTVSGTPGGTVTTTLSGTGVTPGALTLSSKAIDFGSTSVGTTVTRSLTVANNGQTDVSGVQILIADGNVGQFTLVTGASTDCGATIAAGTSCAVRVTFLANKRGTSASTVTMTPADSSGVSATLTGVALGPAALTGDPATMRFPEQEVDVTSPTTATWTVTNTGDEPTASALSLTNDNTAEFSTTTTCTGALKPGGSCTVTVTFKPSAIGTHSANLVVTSGAISAKAVATGNCLLRLTITKTVGGAECSTCTVQSGETSPVVNCGATCSALFAPRTPITLRAATSNGSGHWFSGWTGADASCKGPERTCTFTLTESTKLDALFPAMTSNLIFTSSAPQPTTLGSALAYDTACNKVASAAGINNASGTGYVAWISDSKSLATARAFPSASIQGWVRMDGKVFAASKDDLLTRKAIIYPIAFDENGKAGDVSTITGTRRDGALAPDANCNDWTIGGESGSCFGGSSMGGPAAWTDWWGGPCGSTNSVICMGITGSTTPSLTITPGKKIWKTSEAFIPGSVSPDAWCASHMPSGVTASKAVVARTTSAASSVLSPSTVYVRLDGQRVGTGAEIISVASTPYTAKLLTGIWQDNLGSYQTMGFGRIWTGASSIDAVGSVASTCGNWNDVSQIDGRWGVSDITSSAFFSFANSTCATLGDDQSPIYCIEQ